MQEEKNEGVEISLGKTGEQITAEVDQAQKQHLALRMLTALAATKRRTLSEKSKMAVEANLIGGNREQRRKTLKNMAKGARIAIKREMAAHKKD